MKFYLALALAFLAAAGNAQTGAEDRAFQVQTLTRLAEPVLESSAEGKLKSTLPAHDWDRNRQSFAPLEAFGRTLAGIAPWLELGPDGSPEGKTRARFIDLAVKSLGNAADPQSPDFLNFDRGGQPLVDTAFLALGLLRAPHQLWDRLSPGQQSNLVAALKSSRALKPGENNWLLFSATIEAALWRFTGDCDQQPIEYALRRHEQWYLGDGTYGDGSEFHWDYYNSYVIQPMLLEVLQVCAEKKSPLAELRPKILARTQRYAVVQERMISPEGTFPVLGRSSAYRFGAFHLLGEVSLRHELPAELHPAAVRCGLTAVIRRMMAAPDTLDASGWLQVGAVGHQPSIRESYISTGSLYLCLCGLLPLGCRRVIHFGPPPPSRGRKNGFGPARTCRPITLTKTENKPFSSRRPNGLIRAELLLPGGDLFEQVGQSHQPEHHPLGLFIWSRRDAQPRFAVRNVVHDPGLGADGDLIADFQVARNAHLSRQHAVISQLRAARHTHLRAKDAMSPNFDVVPHLDKIVDLRARADDRGSDGAAIHRRVCANLHVIAEDHVPDLRDFPLNAGIEYVAEAVGPDDRAGVQAHAAPDLRRGIDGSVGEQFGALAQH